jgi:hypothetical protein
VDGHITVQKLSKVHNLHKNPDNCLAKFPCHLRKCSTHCVWNKDFLLEITKREVE